MKGTLLLLALLATGELGFQTTEACFFYYRYFGTVVIGIAGLLDTVFSEVGATAEEREALEKVQDCYNEAGVLGKYLDSKLMEELIFSKECVEFYAKNPKTTIKASFLKSLQFGK